jgi:hypothetical protein
MVLLLSLSLVRATLWRALALLALALMPGWAAHVWL